MLFQLPSDLQPNWTVDDITSEQNIFHNSFFFFKYKKDNLIRIYLSIFTFYSFAIRHSPHQINLLSSSSWLSGWNPNSQQSLLFILLSFDNGTLPMRPFTIHSTEHFGKENLILIWCVKFFCFFFQWKNMRNIFAWHFPSGLIIMWVLCWTSRQSTVIENNLMFEKMC